MPIEIMLGFAGIGLTVILLILTIGSFLWMARNDYRHLDIKMDAMREETKDFHARLTAIEVDFKNFMKCEEEKRTAYIRKHRS